tara:strand:- start:7973 stop:8182 length:210 start_codon:yes stop_codon:yes gene_type:complete
MTAVTGDHRHIVVLKRRQQRRGHHGLRRFQDQHRDILDRNGDDAVVPLATKLGIFQRKRTAVLDQHRPP